MTSLTNFGLLIVDIWNWCYFILILINFLYEVARIRLRIVSFSAQFIGSLQSSLGKFFIMKVFNYFSSMWSISIALGYERFFLLFMSSLFKIQPILMLIGGLLRLFLLIFISFWFRVVILILDIWWPFQIANIYDDIIASLLGLGLGLLLLDVILIVHRNILPTSMIFAGSFIYLLFMLLLRYLHHLLTCRSTLLTTCF